MGIVPLQADIDTIPRVQLIPPLGADLTKYELFTRLYGQIVHGATTNAIPNNAGTPYARPDTVYKDIMYTYAITPYDRYGNLNPRDTMFVSVGARSTDWQFLDLSTGAGAFLMVRSGGVYLRTIPKNTPTNEKYRHDTLRLFNPLPTSAVNHYLGIKMDDRRMSTTVGEPDGESIMHGLLPANIVASRPVDVKKPFAPAPFVLSQPGLMNRDLFRMDHIGCDTVGLEADILTLTWEVSDWDDATGQDNPNDTIKYEWYAIIDSIGGTGSQNTLTISMLADDMGRDNKITIPGDVLRDLVFRPGVMPQANSDSLVMRLKWFIRAYSKTGLETYSDTAGATIRNNPLPTPALIVSINRPPANPPTPISPANMQTVGGLNATSTLSVSWTNATDINLDKGNLIGGFQTYNPVSQTWQTVLNPTSGDPQRTVDTLFYQWVGVVVRTYPVGKGAPLGATIVKNSGNGATLEAVQLEAADIDFLFAGFDPDTTSTSADSVIVEWYVITKDWNYDVFGEIWWPYQPGAYPNGIDAVHPDSAMYSPTSCQPHWIRSGPFTVNLTKLGQGGVEIDPSDATASGDIDKVAGEEVCFTLIAKDDQNQIIRDWDITGTPTTLTIKGSTANTDTSSQTWDANPDGYSYAVIKHNGQILTMVNPDEFSIPPSAFVNGVAVICIIHTKAESGVWIEVTPTFSGLNQNSQKMNFTADAISNFLVEITSATANPDQVYLFRKYEVVVSPRDQFLNVSNKQIRTLFTARFPGEFVNSLPGYSDIFSGDVFITGPTNYFLASTDDRVLTVNQLQTIRAFASNDVTISGITNEYEILNHAPMPFALQTPADKTILQLATFGAQEIFTWDVSADDYTNIAISRFTNEIGNDLVRYTIVFVDSVSLTKKVEIDSDNLGEEAQWTTTHGQIVGIVESIAGGPVIYQPLVWKVRAEDGLYTTWSTPGDATADPRPGFRLSIDLSIIVSNDDVPNVPTTFALKQNFPNPFNPTTTVSYSVPKSNQVTVVVYDLLGNVVKTLVNEPQQPGSYEILWDATNDQGALVPTGNYILKMVAGDFSQTRKMTLLK